MSRIGRLPIPVPSGVEVIIDGSDLTVKGPKGTLAHTIVTPIIVRNDNGTLYVERPNDERDSRSRHGLTRTLVANMVLAVETPTKFKVQGIDKQQVGEVAANIRKLRKPDPYKGKGVRYEGEVIRRKAGKAGKK